jgi:hypothetical protein
LTRNHFYKAFLTVTLPLAFFLVALSLGLKPLADPDLWWHLKTGQWMLEHGELPSEDPFSYTSPAPLSASVQRSLRSQWLGQLLLYAAYDLGGYPGLNLFRAFFGIFPFVLIYLFSVRKGRNPAAVLLIMSPALLIFLTTSVLAFERPQVFSFSLTILLILILGQLRERPKRWTWALLLFLLLALWVNIHGGFILGVVLAAVYGAGLLAEWVAYKDKGAGRALAYLGVGGLVLFIAALLVVPGSYEYFYGFVLGTMKHLLGTGGGSTSVRGNILEYRSLWSAYRDFGYLSPFFIAAFMAFTLVALAMKYLRGRRVDFPEVLVVGVIILFGVIYSRGSLFALVVLPLFLAGAVGRLKKPEGWMFSAACLLLSFIVGFSAWKSTPWQLRPLAVQRDGWVDMGFPAGAVDFIRARDIQGPMFNKLEWGGYLIWRLYPEYKVFIDGRILDTRVTWSYLSVQGASGPWKSTLDVYGVNFMLLELVNQRVGFPPPILLQFLAEETKEWKPVFIQYNSVLFLRDTPENQEIIEAYGLPLEVLYGKIAEFSATVLRSRPGNMNARLAMAIALYGVGRTGEAEQLAETIPQSFMKSKYLGKFKKPVERK